MALPGTYDFARDAWFNGIGGVGKAMGPVSVTRAAAPRGLDRVRENLRTLVTQRLPPSAAGIAIALVTGDQNAVDQGDADAMRRSGLTHLLSVSGLHIASVVAFAMLLTLRLLALSEKLVALGNDEVLKIADLPQHLTQPTISVSGNAPPVPAGVQAEAGAAPFVSLDARWPASPRAS